MPSRGIPNREPQSTNCIPGSLHGVWRMRQKLRCQCVGGSRGSGLRRCHHPGKAQRNGACLRLFSTRVRLTRISHRPSTCLSLPSLNEAFVFSQESFLIEFLGTGALGHSRVFRNFLKTGKTQNVFEQEIQACGHKHKSGCLTRPFLHLRQFLKELAQ